jgi:hypothetical protein
MLLNTPHVGPATWIAHTAGLDSGFITQGLIAQVTFFFSTAAAFEIVALVLAWCVHLRGTRRAALAAAQSHFSTGYQARPSCTKRNLEMAMSGRSLAGASPWPLSRLVRNPFGGQCRWSSERTRSQCACM